MLSIMKCLKWFTIIYTLSCFSTVTPNHNNGKSNTDDDTSVPVIRNDIVPNKTQLNNFLKNIQKKKDIKKRIIKNDIGEKSIDTFFTLSPSSENTENNIWTITNQDLQKSAYLLHIVVSCEYSESLYLFLKVKQKMFNVVFSNDPTTNPDRVKENFLNPITDLLSSMILTLIGLSKYIKYFSNKQQEFLNILLSWYIYIKNSEYIEYEGTKIKYNLNSLNVTIYQVEKYLKQFTINNCQDVKTFEEMKSDIDNQLKSLNNTDNCVQFVTKIIRELGPLLYIEFLKKKNDDVSNIFVITPDNLYNPQLRDLIINQVPPNRSIEINWNGVLYRYEDISTVYNEYKENNFSGIKSLLKYERVVLQMLTKFVIGYIANILKNIIQKPTLNERNLISQIQELMTLLDDYINKFKGNDQPTFLINNLSIIKTYLWVLCFNDESFNAKKIGVEAHIRNLNKLKIELRSDYGLVEFKSFLFSLSNMVICFRLSPLVSNVFWDKLFFVSTTISEYVIDLKYLYSMYENIPENDQRCKKLAYVSYQLKSVDSYIVKWEGVNNITTATMIYNELHTTYSKLQTQINDIVVYTGTTYVYHWKQLLLRLKINDVKSFEFKNNKNYRIQNFKIMQSYIFDHFEVGFHVICKSMPTWTLKTMFQPILSFFEVRFDVVENNAIKENNSFKDFFGTINKFVDQVLMNSNQIDSDLTLYWNGIGMTLEDVYQKYNSYSLDIQENYDYLRFFVRWMLAVIYSRIKNITNKILSSNINYSSTDKPSNQKGALNEFILPLYIDMPINPILDMFFYVTTLSKDEHHDDIKNYEILVDRELNKLGYIPPATSPNSYITWPTIMDELIKKVGDLKNIYARFKNAIEEHALYIGVDKYYPNMMLSKWE